MLVSILTCFLRRNKGNAPFDFSLSGIFTNEESNVAGDDSDSDGYLPEVFEDIIFAVLLNMVLDIIFCVLLNMVLYSCLLCLFCINSVSTMQDLSLIAAGNESETHVEGEAIFFTAFINSFNLSP